MSKISALLLVLFLTMPGFATIVGFDADDFNDLENMHTPIPEMTLWRSKYQHRFDKLYTDVFAISSSDPAKPLGERVIGSAMLPRWDWWDYWSDAPYLYIEINGLARSISMETANHPNWIRKDVVVQCYDIDGNRVANYFTNIGRHFTVNVGEYTIKSVCIWTVGMMSVDDIEIDHIPEPSTIALFSFGLLFLAKRTGSHTAQKL